MNHHHNRSSLLASLLRLDRIILSEIQRTDPADVFPNSAVRESLQRLIKQVEFFFLNNLFSHPESCKLVDNVLLLNRMISFRMNMEPLDATFPGSSVRSELHDLLSSTLYTLRDQHGQYITEMIGPKGLDAEDVKCISSSTTHLIVGKTDMETLDSFRGRIWRGSVSEEPNRRSTLH